MFVSWRTKDISLINMNKYLALVYRGVARGGPGVPVTPPLVGLLFEQTTYNIQVAKMPWQYLGRKSHCWKAHFFKICFFVKYFRQRLLSLVNMGLHAAIIRLSPLIHEGEQRYKPYIVGDPRMVSLSVTPPLKKSWLRPCFSCNSRTYMWKSKEKKFEIKTDRQKMPKTYIKPIPYY